MPSPRRRRERPLATFALVTAFVFGCTTIRAPVASMGSPIQLQDGAAAPQLELWLESADPIKPEEAARVSRQARAALEAALAGRVVGDGSTVLVVRAQGITRSRSHKNDQQVATVALGKRPRGLAVSPDRSTLYVALSGSPQAGPPGQA